MLSPILSDTLNTYSYDANGSRLTKSAIDGKSFVNYQYDVANQLERVRSQDLEVSIQELDFLYGYDGLGRRTSKSNMTVYTDQSAPYYGVDQVDTIYDRMSWQSVGDYYDRVDGYWILDARYSILR